MYLPFSFTSIRSEALECLLQLLAYTLELRCLYPFCFCTMRSTPVIKVMSLKNAVLILIQVCWSVTAALIPPSYLHIVSVIHKGFGGERVSTSDAFNFLYYSFHLKSSRLFPLHRMASLLQHEYWSMIACTLPPNCSWH